MGDRANVLVKDDPSSVYLYTHWDGTNLPSIVQTALIRGQDRWNDGQYLARIIFCEMVQGSEMGLTGYGIASVVGDGGDRIIEVDVPARKVTWRGNVMSFSTFILYANPKWEVE